LLVSAWISNTPIITGTKSTQHQNGNKRAEMEAQFPSMAVLTSTISKCSQNYSLRCTTRLRRETGRYNRKHVVAIFWD